MFPIFFWLILVWRLFYYYILECLYHLSLYVILLRKLKKNLFSTFYPLIISIFDVEVYFLHVIQEIGFCFYTNSVYLCLFIGELNQLILAFFFGSCWFEIILSLSWNFPFNSFCRAEFVDRYCLNLILLWIILIFPYMLIESIAGYNSLCWLLCS